MLAELPPRAYLALSEPEKRAHRRALNASTDLLPVAPNVGSSAPQSPHHELDEVDKVKAWQRCIVRMKLAQKPANVEIRDLLAAHREGTESLFGARRLSDTEYEAAMRSLGCQA